MSFDPTRVQRDLAAIFPGPPFTAVVQLRVASEAFAAVDEAQQVAELLRTYTDGWVCTGSGIYVIRNGDVSAVTGPPAPDWGEVLSAELVVARAGGHGGSVHLRRHGPRLAAHHFAEGVGEACLREEVAYLSTESNLGKLRYAVYWAPGSISAAVGPNIASGLVRRAARFVGFE